MAGPSGPTHECPRSSLGRGVGRTSTSISTQVGVRGLAGRGLIRRGGRDIFDFGVVAGLDCDDASLDVGITSGSGSSDSCEGVGGLKSGGVETEGEELGEETTSSDGMSCTVINTQHNNKKKEEQCSLFEQLNNWLEIKW